MLAVLVQIEARIGKFLAYRAENFGNIPCSNENEDPIVREFAIFHSFAIYLSTIYSLNEYLRQKSEPDKRKNCQKRPRKCKI